MPAIHLTTFIQAPSERVFDLSRSIDLHQVSMHHTKEKAVDGVTTGLINLSETVTWQARHLFKNRLFKTRISAMQPYTFFEDEMAEGDFKSVRHEHHFKPVDNGTIMIDLFYFETSYGRLGEFVNAVFLKRYLRKLLENRNAIIKEYAETNKWKEVLAVTHE